MGMAKKQIQEVNGIEVVNPPSIIQTTGTSTSKLNSDPEFTRSIRIMVQGAVQHASIRPVSNAITIDDYLVETEKVARELIAIQQKILKEMLG